MTAEEYIESGLLELYVAGTLSEKENEEIFQAMTDHPEVREEVERIEALIVQLTAAAAPPSATAGFEQVRNRLSLSDDSESDNVVPFTPPKQRNWLPYTGWAAAIVLLAGLFWMNNQNSDLRQELADRQDDIEAVEAQIAEANESLARQQELIAIFRDRDILAVPLEGQAAFPGAFAKVYWDKDQQNIYLDAQGLPDPPEGKVYQVWSLTLDPLTPTSLGVITGFSEDENKIFPIENGNASEAFGITLEPEGGSDFPTLEQLYTLGAVSSS